jgi:hypothetical protein
VVSFKPAAGAITSVEHQTYKIVCLREVTSGRLRVDTTTTIGGKLDMHKQGRIVILIYKAHMYNETSLDSERCTHESNEKARRNWVLTHLRRVD